jgi:serine/threonine-protein kinase
VLDFEVLKKLADGSAAEAFLARQQGSEKRVILEILRPEVKSDPELTSRFLHEAKALQTLDHPNLIRRAATARTSDGRLFSVSEPVEGESLSATLWSCGSLEVKDVIQLAIPLCDALEYLHRCGCVHGGVKPDLVYLSAEPRAYKPKLLDYRLALFQDGETRRVGDAIFQPEYYSPEWIGGQAVDERSDIYGMGILIYEALTGFPPFTGADAHEVSRKQRTEPLSLPASCERLGTVLRRCLHPDRHERFASALELKQALAREADDDLEATGDPLPRNLPENLEERLASIGPLGDSLLGHAPTDLDQRLESIGAFRAIADSTAKSQTPEEPDGRRKRARSRWTSYAALTLAAFAALGAGWVSRKKPAAFFDRPHVARLERQGPGAIHLKITSEPEGALVTWADSGEPLGTTPISTSVPRDSRALTLRMELPGYRPVFRKIQLVADASAHAKLKELPAASNRRKPARGKHSQRPNRDRSPKPSER